MTESLEPDLVAFQASAPGDTHAPSMRYAAVTPARNEAHNLPRLGRCLLDQTIRPTLWVIVDNGSTDDTYDIASSLALEHDWIRVLRIPGERTAVRGGPVSRAFQEGLAQLDHQPDIVVKLDADVSMASDYFEQLLAEFATDPKLGIASGTCYEYEGGRWRARHVTRSHVRGATRAYRFTCLQAVLPLEERMGWDGIDEIKASVQGWRTTSFLDLPFWHHRRLGEREGARRAWIAYGRMAHYMGYRFSYLLIRTLYRAWREPAALAMLWGYALPAVRHEPRCPDDQAREYLRRQQALRSLPARAREARGKRPS
jgi:biofilm PGA synthesis N-glycosyltransferase PgaC